MRCRCFRGIHCERHWNPFQHNWLLTRQSVEDTTDIDGELLRGRNEWRKRNLRTTKRSSVSLRNISTHFRFMNLLQEQKRDSVLFTELVIEYESTDFSSTHNLKVEISGGCLRKPSRFLRFRGYPSTFHTRILALLLHARIEGHSEVKRMKPGFPSRERTRYWFNCSLPAGAALVLPDHIWAPDYCDRPHASGSFSMQTVGISFPPVLVSLKSPVGVEW